MSAFAGMGVRIGGVEDRWLKGGQVATGDGGGFADGDLAGEDEISACLRVFAAAAILIECGPRLTRQEGDVGECGQAGHGYGYVGQGAV